MGFTEINKILDCGEKISTPEINMTKKGLELYWKYKHEEAEMQMIGLKLELARKELGEWRNKIDEYNWKLEKLRNQNKGMDPPYNEPNPLMCGLGYPPKKPSGGEEISKETWEKFEKWNWIGGQRYNPAMDPMLFEYYDIKPFEPWVMLNISPDWAGKKIQRQNICKLTKIFESYMKEGWYSEWKFVLESGGNGDFLHLHALCKMGSDLKKLKSVRTHIGKSNWKNQLIKYAKAEGLEGILKKPGMQCITIQGESGEEILNDKLDYLVEEKKPAGHKNKTPKTLEKALGVIREGSLLNLLSRETS